METKPPITAKPSLWSYCATGSLRSRGSPGSLRATYPGLVPAEVAAAERLDGLRRPEDLVVHLHDQGQLVHPDHVDHGVCHGYLSGR